MLTPCGAGENSAVPTLLPIPSRSSALAVFCAAAENAVEMTSAAVIAIVLCSRIGCAVYLTSMELFALKFLRQTQEAHASARGGSYRSRKSKPHRLKRVPHI